MTVPSRLWGWESHGDAAKEIEELPVSKKETREQAVEPSKACLREGVRRGNMSLPMK